MKKFLSIVLSSLIALPAYGHPVNNSDVTVRGKVSIEGTAGKGVVQLKAQASDPATPGSGSTDVKLWTKGKKVYTTFDNGSGTAIHQEVGSGVTGSSGFLNYLENGNAENEATNIWTSLENAPVVTISNASPAVVTLSVSIAYQVPNGTVVNFSTTGELPTGLSTSSSYYVVNSGTNTFQVSTTLGGVPVNTSSNGSGTHRVNASYPILNTTFEGSTAATCLAGSRDSSAGNVLNGTASWKIFRDSACKRGTFVHSSNFTVPLAYRDVNSVFSFVFKTDANYATNTIRPFIFDNDTGVVIVPTITAIEQSTDVRGYMVTWMLPARTSSSFRVLYFIASGGPGGGTIWVDDIVVGPGNVPVTGYGDNSPLPACTIIPYSGDVSTPPRGWLVANGDAVSLTTYPDLSCIPVVWATAKKQDGSDQSWTAPAAGSVRLPDLRGIFLRGVGTSSKTNGSYDVTSVLGTWAQDSFESHTHTLIGSANGSALNNCSSCGYPLAGSGFVGDNFSIAAAGTTETAPRHQTVNYLIKAHNARSVYVIGNDNNAQGPLNTTAFTPATPSWLTLGTGGSLVGQYWRDKDKMCFQIYSTLGTGGAVSGYIYPNQFIPASIGTVKYPTSGTYPIGEATCNDAGVGTASGAVLISSSGAMVVYGNAADGWKATVPTTWGSGDTMTYNFCTPMVGLTAEQYNGMQLAAFNGAGVNKSGLVNNELNNTAGTPIKAESLGVAAPSGYAFNTITGTNVGNFSFSRPSVATVSSVPLTPGRWRLSGQVKFTHATGSDYSLDSTASISTTAATMNDNCKNRQIIPQYGGGSKYIQVICKQVLVTTNTTYYLVAQSVAGGGSTTFVNNAETWFEAERLP